MAKPKAKKIGAIVVIIVSIILFIVITILVHRGADVCAADTPVITFPIPGYKPPDDVIVKPHDPNAEDVEDVVVKPRDPNAEDTENLPRPWDPVKDRLADETPDKWSDRIYSIMVSGRRSNTSEGGVQHNIDQCGLRKSKRLTKATAKCLCRNPCTHRRKQTVDAQACKCYDDGRIAVINY